MQKPRLVPLGEFVARKTWTGVSMTGGCLTMAIGVASIGVSIISLLVVAAGYLVMVQ